MMNDPRVGAGQDASNTRSTIRARAQSPRRRDSAWASRASSALMARAMAVPVSRFLAHAPLGEPARLETPTAARHRRRHLPEPDPRPVGPRAERRAGAGCAADRSSSSALWGRLQAPGSRPSGLRWCTAHAAGLKPCPSVRAHASILRIRSPCRSGGVRCGCGPLIATDASCVGHLHRPAGGAREGGLRPVVRRVPRAGTRRRERAVPRGCGVPGAVASPRPRG